MHIKRWGIAVLMVVGSTLASAAPAHADGAAPTATGIWCRPIPVVVGGTLSCDAQVTDSGSGAQLPDGTQINVVTSDPDIAPQSCVQRGFCTIDISPVSATPGPLTITAQFDGDAEHAPSSGSVTVEVVAPELESTTGVYCIPDVVQQGQQGSCIVTVWDLATGAAVPDGWVDVALDGDGLSGDGGCFIHSGHCTVLAWTGLEPWRGRVTVTASYWGSSTYLPSSGTTHFDVVEPTEIVAKPAIANLVSPTHVNLEMSARLTDARDHTPIAGETVRFVVSGTTLCTGVTDASGVATCASLTDVIQAANGYRAIFDTNPVTYRYKSSTSGAGVRV